MQDIVKISKLPESVVSLQIESIISYYPETDISSLFDKKELIPEVLSKTEEGDECLVEVSVTAANDSGNHASGSAIISLPK